MNVNYTPGSLYKRFGPTGAQKQSNMQRMNLAVVRANESAIANAGSIMFGASVTESEGRSELAAKQLLARVQQEAAAKSSSSLNLGALLNKSS